MRAQAAGFGGPERTIAEIEEDCVDRWSSVWIVREPGYAGSIGE